MKRMLLTVAALLAFATTALADNFGSTFGALTTASATGRGETYLGGRVGIADATSFVASIGRGFTDKADGRFKMGLIDDELFKTELILGADLKWQVWNVETPAAQGQTAASKYPFDLAVGPFAEWVKFGFDNNLVLESETVFQLGAQIVGSYPVHLKNGALLSPYSRINLRNEWYSANLAPGVPSTGGLTDSHLALGFNRGLAWRPRGMTTVFYGEIQIDGNDGVFLGADFRL
jgi:hypothetical protein